MLRSTEEFKQKSESIVQQRSSGSSQHDEASRLRGVTPPPPGAPGQGGTAVDLESLAQLSSLLMPGETKKVTAKDVVRAPAAPAPAAPAPEEKTPSPVPDETPVDTQLTDPYGAAIACSDAVLRALREGQLVDVEWLIRAVRELVQRNKGTEEYLLRAIHEERFEKYLAIHSTNVMIIATKIGEAMKYDDNQLFLLGLTAFLHDLGMLTVPARKGTFSDEDKALVRNHPEVTREFIKTMGPELATIADIAAQEQEREDGSGYPAGLSGDQIHEFAKIIGLADTYEAMTHSRLYRDGFVAYKALKEVIDLRTSKFSRKVVKALIDVVSVYPLGSLVKLNTGAIGRIMMKSDTHPTRPTIRLLKDSQGKKVIGERLINLEHEPMLFIADAQVAESEVEE